MAKSILTVTVRADIDDFKSLINDVGCLQTYKMSEGDELILVARDDVLDLLIRHMKMEEQK